MPVQVVVTSHYSISSISTSRHSKRQNSQFRGLGHVSSYFPLTDGPWLNAKLSDSELNHSEAARTASCHDSNVSS